MTDVNIDPWVCTICGLRYSSASMGGPGICPACDCGFSGPTLIRAQRDEIDVLRKDAERYRWLRQNALTEPEPWNPARWELQNDPEVFDAWVDGNRKDVTNG